MRYRVCQASRMFTKLRYCVGLAALILCIFSFYHQVQSQERKQNKKIDAKLGSPEVRLGSRVPVHTASRENVSLSVLSSKVPVIPVIVFSCNRPSIKRNLDQLIKYRPSAAAFPIYVSQDCGNEATANVIKSYGNQLTHLKYINNNPVNLPPNELHLNGYYKIARHYHWGLNQIFQNYSAAIVLEDDLDISPDFFEYFSALYPVLLADSSLWCVSAWNDNGRPSTILNKPEILHRSDFFPGLGWMLRKEVWLELEREWPKAFWDDWMRNPKQRKNRACIRPEVSRTYTFGKIGVSQGLFFEQHLQFIKLNDIIVPFRQRNLTYLIKEKYDLQFIKEVYEAPAVSAESLELGYLPRVGAADAVRVQYYTKDEFIWVAEMFGLMTDFKAGVPRGGYKGVVSFGYNGRRVFLAPPLGWKQYDRTWT